MEALTDRSRSREAGTLAGHTPVIASDGRGGLPRALSPWGLPPQVLHVRHVVCQPEAENAEA